MQYQNTCFLVIFYFIPGNLEQDSDIEIFTERRPYRSDIFWLKWNISQPKFTAVLQLSVTKDCRKY